MKSIPTDPMAQHQRFISALCEDWLEAGKITRVTPRADAVLHLTRQFRNLKGGEK